MGKCIKGVRGWSTFDSPPGPDYSSGMIHPSWQGYPKDPGHCRTIVSASLFGTTRISKTSSTFWPYVPGRIFEEFRVVIFVSFHPIYTFFTLEVIRVNRSRDTRVFAATKTQFVWVNYYLTECFFIWEVKDTLPIIKDNNIIYL